MEPLSARLLRSRVGSLRQYAGVRRIVLDDGPERGTRAIAFSTGGGLDFWLLTDRAMDIGPLWWRGRPIAWQAPNGYVHPSLCGPDNEGSRGFERAVSGFLMSCGLDHIRQPVGGRPLHGRLPLTPARVLSAGEDWDIEAPILYAESETVQFRLGGESLSMRRRVEAPIGGCELRITDIVRNDAAQPQPHDLLYHFNVGHPAICDGSRVLMGDECVLGPIRLADPTAMPAAGCRAVASGADASCTLITQYPDGSELRIRFGFDGTALGHLQLWNDFRPNCGLLAIEPCVSRWVEGGGSAGLPTLSAGESRTYRLSVRFSGA